MSLQQQMVDEAGEGAAEVERANIVAYLRREADAFEREHPEAVAPRETLRLYATRIEEGKHEPGWSSMPTAIPLTRAPRTPEDTFRDPPNFGAPSIAVADFQTALDAANCDRDRANNPLHRCAVCASKTTTGGG